MDPPDRARLAAECFAPLLGQPQAVTLLTQAVVHDRIAPAYLFAGPAGTGRALAARCFTTLLCALNLHVPRRSSRAHLPPPTLEGLRHRVDQDNHPDVLWVEASYQVQGKVIPLSQAEEAGVQRKTPPQIRLSQVREVSQFLSRAPLEALRHVVVLEQAETMGEGAANGLLKTLEEPGPATLILLAPSADRLLPTLVSRCQRIPFQRLAEGDLAEILRRSGQAQLLENPRLLAQAEGSPGAAIELGEYLQSLDPDLLAQAQDLPRSPRQALDLARRISQDLDLDQQTWLLSYLQQCCWCAPYDQVPDRIAALEEAKGLLGRSVQPRLVWEVMLLRLAGVVPQRSV